MTTDIPGFYFDQARGRYFRMTDQTGVTASASHYTREHEQRVQQLATELAPVERPSISGLLLGSRIGDSEPDFDAMQRTMIKCRWKRQFISPIAGISPDYSSDYFSCVKVFTSSQAHSVTLSESRVAVDTVRMANELCDSDYYHTWDMSTSCSLGRYTVGASHNEPVLKVVYISECKMILPKLGVTCLSMATPWHDKADYELIVGCGKSVQYYYGTKSFVIQDKQRTFKSDIVALECRGPVDLIGQRDGTIVGYAQGTERPSRPVYKIRHPTSPTKLVPIGKSRHRTSTSPFMLATGLRESMCLYDVRMLRDTNDNCATKPLITYPGYRQGPHYKHGLCISQSLIAVSDTDNRVKLYDILSGRRLNGGELTDHKFENRITGLAWGGSGQDLESNGIYVASGDELTYWSSRGEASLHTVVDGVLQSEH